MYMGDCCVLHEFKVPGFLYITFGSKDSCTLLSTALNKDKDNAFLEIALVISLLVLGDRKSTRLNSSHAD